MNAPARVCFLPSKAPTWPEMADLAGLLALEGWARPLMLLAGARGQAYLPDCQARGLDHLLLEDAPREPPPGLARRAWHKLLLSARGPAACLEPLAQPLERVLAHQEGLLAQALDDLRPAAVITADERLFNWELPLIGLCRRRGIPVIVPPVSFLADRESLLPFRHGPLHQAGDFPDLARRHPQQAAQVSLDQAHQAGVLFYPAPMTLALDRRGLLPERPWLPGGGGADLLLLDGQLTLERCLAAGASPEKLLVSGQLSHDQLHARYLEGRAIKAAEGPEVPRRLVLSLPQLAEQGSLGWDEHWQEIRFLVQALAGLPCQSLLSLHPKMERAQYRFLEDDYGLVLADRPLAQVLPQAHVFAASYSSTVAWAALCRIPALVFDFYGLDFQMYDDWTGVRLVKRRQDLAPELTRLLSDRAYYADLEAQQARWAARLAPFDGLSGQRILAAIRQRAEL